MASVRSLDNALVTSAGLKVTDDMGVTQIPNNGRIMRNLIEGADVVMSHITHFYVLAALDYVDVSPVGPFFSPTYTGAGVDMVTNTNAPDLWNHLVGNYVQALTMRRKAHTMGAILSGRQPIQNAIVPGGVTTLPTASDMVKFDALLNDVRGFINTAYVPDLVTVGTVGPTIFTSWTNYWTTTGSTSVISYGQYPCQDGTAPESLLLTRGVNTAGSPVEDDTVTGPTGLLNKVIEDTTYSYYNNTADGLHPFAGQTNPDISKVNNGTQYTWLKAPRYNGTAGRLVCEVGPLARMVVSTLNTAMAPAAVAIQAGASQPSVLFAGLPEPYSASDIAGATLGAIAPLGEANLFSTFGRHACRAIECKLVADAMAAWSAQLQTNLSGPSYIYAKLPNKPAKGAGWTEAPRGALGHWITIEKKKIVGYQCVVPTTWNHSPKCSVGAYGPAEHVVSEVNLGTSSLDQQIVNILRAVHPFDFCIACAVHMVTPDGKTIAKFKTDLDGKVTILPNDAEI